MAITLPPTYNQVIRKITVAFGSLFNNIPLVRYDPAQFPALVEQSRIVVPIVYGPKELYVMRLEGDPNLDKKVQMTLPIISYDLVDVSYDSTRKLNTAVKNYAQGPNGILSQYNPVPYNFNYKLYIYVRNTEDGFQIIERILPFFTPTYTLSINLIPEMGAVKELPVTLNNTIYDISYEGHRDDDPRRIIWELDFTVQGNIYGAINSSGTGGPITHSITNFYNLNPNQTTLFNMTPGGTGTYQMGELVYQGGSPDLAQASAQVQDFANNVLYLTSLSGNFVSNQPIIGITTGAIWNFSSSQVANQLLERIDIVPDPLDATANSNYGYTTTITP